MIPMTMALRAAHAKASENLFVPKRSDAALLMVEAYAKLILHGTALGAPNAISGGVQRSLARKERSEN